jgi:hypothetical protein
METNRYKNEIGKRYGKLIAVKYIKSNNNKAVWLYHCDCGNDTEVLGNSVRSGRTLSCGCIRREATRERSTGTRAYQWKGGKKRTNEGYVMILKKDHPRSDRDGYVFEHIIIMENALGCRLPDKAVVHHVNKIRDDNRPENLVMFENSVEHLAFHRKQARVTL